jgi:hypothetical protein
MPPLGVDVPRAERDALAGVYRGPAGVVTVTSTDAGLQARADDPMVFASVGQLAAPGGRFAPLEKQTEALVAAEAAGDVEPTIRAMRFERPERAAQERDNQRKLWQEWRDTYGGEFEQLELLGTGVVQGDPAVTVRVRFQRGGPVLQYIWGPVRLAGFRVAPAETVTLQAESPARWVHYGYRLPQLITVTFGAGELTVAGPSGSLTARRQAPEAR